MLWAIRAMQQRYHAVGITSMIDRGQTAPGWAAYQDLHRGGALTLRTYMTWLVSAKGTPDAVRQEIERIPVHTGDGDDVLRVGSLKTVIDGGILIGTAYLREVYGLNTAVYGYKDPDYRGVNNIPKENLAEMARTAARLGWQMTAHAAGGGAIDALLEAYETADRTIPIRDRRFTVSHGNFPDAQAIARAKKLGVVFDCQPAWHHYDGPALKDVFGPRRMEHFIPLRSLLDAGIVVAGGSDHMIRFDSRNAINPYHPFFGMWMTITRQTVDGAVLGPEQKITREEALRLWTLNGAYLTFEEKQKGSIEPNKLADFAVIDKDYQTIPENEIKTIETLLTVVGGKPVFGSLP
jgi:predicted amidohydrolase YtcJ